LASTQNESRIQALEARVGQLTEFNQILLDHLLRAQDFNGPGKGPLPENVHRWVIDMSNAVWSKYHVRRRL
jgi:hypothetical protein